jgi:hypothetical protein
MKMKDNTPISYQEFGNNFVRHVISADRLRRELDGLLRSSSIAGTVEVLPAELMRAEYSLQIDALTVEPGQAPEFLLGYRLGIQGTLDLLIRVLGLPLKFSVAVLIRIDIDVYTYAPLTIRLQPQKVTRDAVQIEINPGGVPEEVLDKLNIIEPALAEEIVRQVNQRIKGDEVVNATTIDILRLAHEAQLSSSKPAIA